MYRNIVVIKFKPLSDEINVGHCQLLSIRACYSGDLFRYNLTTSLVKRLREYSFLELVLLSHFIALPISGPLKLSESSYSSLSSDSESYSY